ncbi:tRNA lysidine(34) synthetase TilS [Horticoccus luteus]|uniref:tRNA(Ile)-lysidine synthase n=1 Tax=Horticoccus luteus TaxID=2862869 RepID=A0A8F9TZK0_9BACT|nr:tRNA lysidine(34) synthetase TilS [Horticoccus luteus]QYM80402.1 tRNA lysidine(34) synthetase TilS [Horticoccus luteus]
MARRLIDWPSAAVRLAEVLPRERLHPRVVAWAVHPRNRATPWTVALSGGADSLSVLLLLWGLWPEQRRRLRVVHFDHRLRGRSSMMDARFCAEVCHGLGLALKMGRWDERPLKVSEATARAARMAFFDQVLERQKESAIWFGHQQDDIAETLLMRLARGSGTAGLAAPRPVQAISRRRVHLRPLLTLSKAEITQALTGANIPWREDASNARATFLRNRIRRSVVPAWSEAVAGRNVLQGAALARELIEEDDAALEEWTERLPLFTPAGALRLAAIAGCPRAVKRRALARWLAQHQLVRALSRQAVDALLQAIERGGAARHSVGRDVFAVIRRGLLCIERRKVVKAQR